MSAAWIILNSARRSRERWEEEQKEIQKKEAAEEMRMRSEGYVKERVLQNPNYRYHHTYRNIAKQNYGTLLIAISIAGIVSISTTLIALGTLSSYFIIPILVFMITWIIGSNKFNNEDVDWSPNEKAEDRPGYYHISTKDNARYGFEWVKKKK